MQPCRLLGVRVVPILLRSTFPALRTRSARAHFAGARRSTGISRAPCTPGRMRTLPVRFETWLCHGAGRSSSNGGECCTHHQDMRLIAHAHYRPRLYGPRNGALKPGQSCRVRTGPSMLAAAPKPFAPAHARHHHLRRGFQGPGRRHGTSAGTAPQSGGVA